MSAYTGKDDKKCQEAVNISLSDIQKENEDVSRETSSLRKRKMKACRKYSSLL